MPGGPKQSADFPPKNNVETWRVLREDLAAYNDPAIALPPDGDLEKLSGAERNKIFRALAEKIKAWKAHQEKLAELEKNTAPVNPEKIGLSVEFLKGYTEKIQRFFDICEKIRTDIEKSAIEIKTQYPEKADIVEKLLEKFETKIKQIDVERWKNIIKEINTTGKTTSSEIPSAFKQVQSVSEKEREFRRVFFNGLSYGVWERDEHDVAKYYLKDTYMGSMLILAEEMRNIHRFIDKEQKTVMNIEKRSQESINELLLASENVGAKFKYIPLFENFEMYAGQIYAVDKNPDQTLQYVKGLHKDDISEIFCYGFENGFEEERTFVYLGYPRIREVLPDKNAPAPEPVIVEKKVIEEVKVLVEPTIEKLFQTLNPDVQAKILADMKKNGETDLTAYLNNFYNSHLEIKIPPAEETKKTAAVPQKTSRRDFVKLLGTAGLGAVLAGGITGYFSGKSNRETKEKLTTLSAKLGNQADSLLTVKEELQEKADSLQKVGEQFEKEKDYKERKAALEAKIDWETYNQLPEDAQSIYRYMLGVDKSFAIIDKITATIYLVNQDKKMIVKAPVGIGRVKGDGINLGTDKNHRAINNTAYTPPGKFLLSFDGISETDMERYGGRVLNLGYEDGGKLLWHIILPLKEYHDKRAKAIATATPEDNYLSEGCPNTFEPADWDKYVFEPGKNGELPTKGNFKNGGEMFVMPDNQNMVLDPRNGEVLSREEFRKRYTEIPTHFPDPNETNYTLTDPV